MALFKRTYTVSSKEWPDAKLIGLVVDRDGKKYVTAQLPDGEQVEIRWYHVTGITYRGWFMRFIYRKAQRELPDLRERFLNKLKPLSGEVKYQRELLRTQKLLKSKKRLKAALKPVMKKSHSVHQ